MSTEHDVDEGRRAALKTIGVAAAAGTLGAAGARPAAAQSDDFETWFENVENYDGVVDRTGQDEVTIEVGAQGNGGAFAFGPAAVRVDPGTTVVWEWTGGGGSHDVVAEDGSFESDPSGEAGATFEHTFDAEGVTRYVCTPHAAMGMKGAVVVGDVDVGGASAGGGSSGGGGGDADFVEPDFDGWFDDVENYDGVVDATGQDEVTVEVGAQGNGGAFAFEPAAVHVDPGTTVVWEWTGEGGSHNVVSEDPAFESDLLGDAGDTYAVEFDGAGVAEYVCTPHEAVGMKGAVVVGNPAASGGGGPVNLETALLGLASAIVAAPFVASEFVARKRRDPGDGDGRRPPVQRGRSG